MSYAGIRLRNYIHVDLLHAFHYFEFTKDYVFHGEKHDFWELFYVDKGEVIVHVEEVPYELKQGDVMLYKPNAYHRLSANRVSASNLFDIAFESDSPVLDHLANRLIRLNESERGLLAQIVKEGFQAFAPPYNQPDVHTIVRQPDAPEGSEQLLQNYLEILLIRLIRRAHGGQEPGEKLPFVPKEKRERDLVRSVTAFLRDRLNQDLSLDAVCESFGVGKTHITRLFKRRTGYPLMEYFKRLKVEQAKLLVREEQHNFTEISRLLGYSSIHHFSKAFKKYAGMTPSDYAKSIQARAADSRGAGEAERDDWADPLTFGPVKRD
ncbi:AraC family transcriptional regulator [Paenibacillus ginsengarvi]|uniref:AraC family transcriptional regulator n=1 Tax=Paenibacillus ginsengarvi TaxID=400777 RepID=A0A3B0C8Q1_9BACL|nr:AraC family transcriptional regulator [Paenibacillus ginsengarvi]RKN79196.1 AraC family transcriptional regulator [Paenibacillus ginsengarvi]